MTFRLIEADCVDAMADMDEASVDAIVTDPPYGLEFMGKEWDSFKTGRSAKYASMGEVAAVSIPGTGFSQLPTNGRPAKRCANCGKQSWSGSPCMCETPRWVVDNSPLLAFQAWCETWATEALRVLKPGGHLLAFGGTRTFHRLTCALEDAGFEIRDCLSWLYGSGFPKSLDVSKAIDKAAGAEREVVGPRVTGDGHIQNRKNGTNDFGTFKIAQDGIDMDTAPATPDAQRWQGWGTALKPAWEPVVLARKPLAGTVAANVLEYGTGAINVDGCRVEHDGRGVWGNHGQHPENHVAEPGSEGTTMGTGWMRPGSERNPAGRWPANVVLDETAAALLDEQSGETSYNPAGVFGITKTTGSPIYGGGKGLAKAGLPVTGYGDTGGASRFFYTAKAGRQERNNGKRSAVDAAANLHPTVKPVSLMQWLVRMVTPPGGTVLDPFTGSGSTGIAALREGFDFIGIEREHDYVEIARDRIIGDAPLFNQEVTPTDRPA